MPEKCGHNICFNAVCRECEILWAEEFIQYHERKLRMHRERLSKLKATPTHHRNSEQ